MIKTPKKLPQNLLNSTMRYVLCFFLVALAIACSQDKKIKLSDIRGAERIIGLEFSESEEDTLLDYLRENR